MLQSCVPARQGVAEDAAPTAHGVAAPGRMCAGGPKDVLRALFPADFRVCCVPPILHEGAPLVQAHCALQSSAEQDLPEGGPLSARHHPLLLILAPPWSVQRPVHLPLPLHLSCCIST